MAPMATLAKEYLKEEIKGWGVDIPLERRPGVPMESTPQPDPDAHWVEPERQRARVHVFKRVGLEELTPVFGTAQPPRGISGILRAFAYRIPGHKASHWMTLLFADRVDWIESGITDALGGRRRTTLLALSSAFVLMAGMGVLTGRKFRKLPY